MKKTIMTIVLTLGVTLSVSAGTASAITTDPPLSQDGSNPTVVPSANWTFTVQDHRSYVTAVLENEGYSDDRNGMRSGPDENGVYTFTFTFPRVPKATAALGLIASTAPHGYCHPGDPAACESVEYFVRGNADGPDNRYRDFGLTTKQRGRWLKGTYRFIAGGPAMVHQKLVVRARRGTRRYVVGRASARPQRVEENPAASSYRQAKTARFNVCARRARRALRAGNRLTWRLTAYLVVDGRKVGKRTRRGGLRVC